MGNSYPEIRKFSGLYLQANSFEVPDGGLEICSNVEIQSDAILSKTHGWYSYYNSALGTFPIRTLVTYQKTLMAFSGFVQYFDVTDQISPDPTYSPQLGAVTLSGDAFNQATPARTAEQNLNLYFTTLSGIYKLESFSGKVRKSGVPPGLDLRATATSGVSGPLPPDSQTGYRILFGRRDTNGNLLLGSPSDIATVGLDPDGTGFAYTSTGAGPYTITVTTLEPHGLRVGDQIIVTNDADANVTQTVSAVPSPTTFRYVVVANPGATGTLDFSYSRQATLEFSIPSEIDDATDDWFYQAYRTTSSAGVIVSPSPDFALIAEAAVTATDISLGFIFFTDNVDPLLNGAELYTNPNSREGELQANARPPLAADITLYKEYMLYANVQTRQRLALSLVNPTGITNSTQIVFLHNVTQEIYQATQSSVGNQSLNATAVAGVGTVTITYANHGASNGWMVDIEQVTGSVPRGTYVISGVTVNTFNISSPSNTATAITFSFLSNGVNPIFFADSTSTSLAVQIANTAYYLVKAINRNSAIMYANYASGFDDVPGQMRFELKFFDQQNTALYVRLNTNVPQPFLPPLPTSFGSGTQVYSLNDILPDSIFISKLGEPDAVPITNFIRAGAKNKAIRRIFSLRDSVIILKEDGIFKLTGDTLSQFSVTIIDGTVLISTSLGADKINNSVLAMSNQGAVSISESSVQIISRRIDDVIQPVVSGEVAQQVLAPSLDDFVSFGYETGRTWYVCQKNTINGITPITYMYNVLNQSWTSTDVLFEAMGLGPDGTIYISQGQETSTILRQRKSFTIVDYSNEFSTGTAYSTSATSLFVQQTAGVMFTLAPGDVVLYNNFINRITLVMANGPGYDVTLAQDTTIPLFPTVSDVSFYQGYASDMKFSPFHAGEVGREKQFSQFQLHLRQNSITNLAIDFSNETFLGSGSTQWEAQLVTQTSTTTTIDGWGDGSWGLFEWGSVASSGTIQVKNGTFPALIIRTYIPILASRTTFVQALLNHRQACEPLLIQSMSYVVRGYGERVTR